MSEVVWTDDQLELLQDVYYELYSYDSETESCRHCGASKRRRAYLVELDHRDDCEWWRLYQILHEYGRIEDERGRDE